MIRSIRLYSSGSQFRELFKSSMSRISSQAMILTAGFDATTRNKTSLHGMTLSSVCSLSTSPIPLLQFNLHLPSYTSQSLHENNGILAIHLLPPTPKAVRLGRIFASGVKRETKKLNYTYLDTSEQELEDGDVFHEMTTPFNNISNDDWKEYKFTDKLSIPIIKEAERVFICKKRQVFEVDSHEIWAVEVLEITSPNNNYNIAHNEDKTGGLLYYDRSFHKIGDALREY
ncbi:unnamed protein product [Debaryomyces fabryi]|nr:unnamed protein product [Debaryomyces fabryi]